RWGEEDGSHARASLDLSHRERHRARRPVRAEEAPGGLHSRRPGAHRHARRLRARDLRRVHGDRERRGGAIVPDAGGAGRGRRDPHDRRAGERREVPSAPGSVPPASRAPVRVLHSGDAADGARFPARQSPSHRARDPRRDRGGAVPVHGLPGHREGGRRRREGARTDDGLIGAPDTRRDVGLIGASVPRVEDARFLAGHGRYLADLAFPGVLHVAFLRSPHAHARIGRVDLASARAMPGVVTCVTAADLRDTVRPLRAASRMTGYHATDLLPLAADKVRYQGEPVVAVVAESRYVAEDAVDAIAVEWSPLPPVPDARAAMAAESPLVHEEFGTNVILTRAFRHGDVDPALAGAALVVRERFRFRRHAALPIENRAALAAWNADGLTLWSSTQVPGMVRDALAESLAVPGHRIRVVAPDVGGGFGLKSSVYAEEIAVAALARRVGRPVKWIGDRREDLLASTQAWDEEIDATLALDGHGTIRGLRASVLADVGAYSIVPWTASIEVIQVISFLPGPYRVPAYLGEGAGVATNKAPMGPYRGVGRPVATFVMESLLDRAARRLGLDPREIRR